MVRAELMLERGFERLEVLVELAAQSRVDRVERGGERRLRGQRLQELERTVGRSGAEEAQGQLADLPPSFRDGRRRRRAGKR